MLDFSNLKIGKMYPKNNPEDTDLRDRVGITLMFDDYKNTREVDCDRSYLHKLTKARIKNATPASR